MAVRGGGAGRGRVFVRASMVPREEVRVPVDVRGGAHGAGRGRARGGEAFLRVERSALREGRGWCMRGADGAEDAAEREAQAVHVAVAGFAVRVQMVVVGRRGCLPVCCE